MGAPHQCPVRRLNQCSPTTEISSPTLENRVMQASATRERLCNSMAPTCQRVHSLRMYVRRIRT